MMMIWDFKREGDALFQHLICKVGYGRVLTPGEATEAPRQGSRSPLSPTEVTESAIYCTPLFDIVCLAAFSK